MPFNIPKRAFDENGKNGEFLMHTLSLAPQSHYSYLLGCHSMHKVFAFQPTLCAVHILAFVPSFHASHNNNWLHKINGLSRSRPSQRQVSSSSPGSQDIKPRVKLVAFIRELLFFLSFSILEIFFSRSSTLLAAKEG
jgi:hypothetical protein